ncbi:MAG: hypothetical protein DCF13_12580 [Flavobacteriaceae bacterium]|nr:MAG: hypothetical protein DCF13_12580 [Flavobacteriaceae bacterium]
MKSIKNIIVLYLLLATLSNIYGQDYPRYTVEMPSKTSAESLEKQLLSGEVILSQIEIFPFEQIYKTNKNIKSLTICISSKLNNVTENIKKLKSLKKIDIYGVSLTEFPVGLCYIDSLIDLRYINNQTSVIPKEIGKLKNLKILRFETLPIKEIPKEIGNLKNLEELYIQSNANILNVMIADSIFKLEGINYLPKEIGRLKALKKLTLANNNLQKIPSEIGLLSNLTCLKIGMNNLKTIPLEIFNLINLEILSLSNNPLNELSENIGNLKNLKVLELYDCKLKTLPKSIENLKKLERLNVEKNDISEEELIEIKKKLPNTQIYNGKIIK